MEIHNKIIESRMGLNSFVGTALVGKQIHAQIIKKELQSEVYDISSTLVYV